MIHVHVIWQVVDIICTFTCSPKYTHTAAFRCYTRQVKYSPILTEQFFNMNSRGLCFNPIRTVNMYFLHLTVVHILKLLLLSRSFYYIDHEINKFLYLYV